MPKRGSQARPNQPSAVPVHMRSHLARKSTSTARKHGTMIEKQEDDMEAEEEDAADEDGDEDSMVEMLAVLQEMQKRKASKSSARSIAFRRERDALYTTARKKAEASLRDGMASLDKARALISDLKAKELNQEATLTKFKAMLSEQNACIQTLLDHHTTVIEDLSHRRAGQINEASAMLEAHTNAREKSRKKIYALANARMAENLENQKVTADASALIKHYKALLLG